MFKDKAIREEIERCSKSVLSKSDLFKSNRMYSVEPSFHTFFHEGNEISTIFMIDKDLFNQARNGIPEMEGVRPSYRRRGSMFLKGGLLGKIGRSLLSGNGIRKTSRLTGASKSTVAKLHRILCALRVMSGEGDILCKCGKSVLHRGWCSERLKSSPARVRFLRGK